MTQFTERAGTASEASLLASRLERIGRQRDREAFRELFDRFAPRIRAFLASRGVAPAVADDLTQEVMLTIWRRAESYDRSKAAASTWIFTIARNRHIDHYRKNQRARALDEDDPQLQPDPAPAADRLVEQSQDAGRVARALSELPADQRDIIELAFSRGWSHSEIAENLALPLGTVKSRIRLAMARLKMSLGEWS